jgi:two-component system cell cycle response regulator CpdR
MDRLIPFFSQCVALAVQAQKRGFYLGISGRLRCFTLFPGIPHFNIDTQLWLGDDPFEMFILVAEDDDDVRELIASIMRTDGCQVDLVSGGMEAIRAFADRKYDLVITDFEMPGLNGIELARSIHDLEPSTPVVMVTGKPLNRRQKAAIERAAIAEVIRKPFTTSEILSLRKTYAARPVRVSQRR